MIIKLVGNEGGGGVDNSRSYLFNYEVSDHFLAKALSDLEQGNVYKKPLGKSYRKVRKVDSVSTISTSTPSEKIDANVIPRSPPSSPFSTTSSCD